jgi:hypothetical protein
VTVAEVMRNHESLCIRALHNVETLCHTAPPRKNRS